MLKDTAMKIKHVVSPGRIKYNVNELSLFHRIVASPDIVACAEEIAKKFAADGIESGTWAFESADDILKGSWALGDCWTCLDGWCEVVGDGGRRICDWNAERLSVAARSAPCDHSAEPIELIPMDKGLSEAAYEGVDFRGKAVLFMGEGSPGVCVKWVKARGALGCVNGMVSMLEDVRGAYNQYDTIAWFTVNRYADDFFGFGITPREADRLYRRFKKEGKLFIRCKVDCTAEPGIMKNAWGLIRGETDEEIIITGHICHPRPSANDNLSGATAAMEALRTLDYMIKQGILPKPRRSIRAILLPEMRGSAAACEDWKDHGPIMAGINLDMVGARQGAGNGPVSVYDVHPSLPSFIGSVQGIALDAARSDTPDHVFMGDDISLYNWREAMYSNSSDQDIWAEPISGVPMTSLTQWPDIFYHTSTDEPHVIDYGLCARSAAIAASTAYILACLSPEDLPEIMTRSFEIIAREIKLLSRRCPRKYFGKAAKAYRNFFVGCNNDFLRFFSGSELELVRPMVERQNKKIAAYVEMMASAALGEDICLDDFTCDGTGIEGMDYIPKKLCCGAIYNISVLHSEFDAEVAEFEKKYGAALNGYSRHAIQCFADGSRRAAEVAELGCIIGNCYNIEAADAYMRLLGKMGWFEIK